MAADNQISARTPNLMSLRTNSRRKQTYAQSRVPRYLQVASALRQRIREGHWTVGDKISTLQALENEYQVARVTVRQAIDILQTEGLLESHQGKGTYVIKSVDRTRWLQLATDWDALIRPIRNNVPHLLPVEEPPPPQIGPDDGTPADSYHFIRSLQTRGKDPYAVASVHIAEQVYKRNPEAFSKRVALAVIAEMDELDLSRAHETLVVGSADVQTARLLQTTLNAPIAEARCVVSDANGVVIYIGEITYRGDCVRLNIELM